MDELDSAAAHESLNQITNRNDKVERNAQAVLTAQKAASASASASTAAAPSASASASASSSGGKIGSIFANLGKIITPELVAKTKSSYQFHVNLPNGETAKYYLDLKNGNGAAAQGELQGAEVLMTTSEDTFIQMFTGAVKPTGAYFSGKLKIKGDISKAIKLEKLMSLAPKL